jgi:hypothetical protein
VARVRVGRAAGQLPALTAEHRRPNAEAYGGFSVLRLIRALSFEANDAH